MSAEHPGSDAARRATADTAADFSRRATLYAASSTHAAGDDLDLVEELANPARGDWCLDVATGTGPTALRIAARASFAVGLDASSGMLAQAVAAARARGVSNVAFQRGDAAALPFVDASFDLVTCRIAPHHFADVSRAMREIARVLKPTGRFVLEDSLGPADPELAAWLEALERARDRTHVHSLSRDEWRACLEQAGLRVEREFVREKSRDYVEWLERGGLAPTDVERLVDVARAAPSAVRARFFDGERGHPTVFRDEKWICRATSSR